MVNLWICLVNNSTHTFHGVEKKSFGLLHPHGTHQTGFVRTGFIKLQGASERKPESHVGFQDELYVFDTRTQGRFAPVN
jgi:hypothetical protein